MAKKSNVSKKSQKKGKDKAINIAFSSSELKKLALWSVFSNGMPEVFSSNNYYKTNLDKATNYCNCDKS